MSVIHHPTRDDGLRTEVGGAHRTGRPVGQGRRLSDRILSCVHQAIDQRQLTIARALLGVCEEAVKGAPPGRERRKGEETLVAAYERLFLLVQDERDDDRVGFPLPLAS